MRAALAFAALLGAGAAIAMAPGAVATGAAAMGAAEIVSARYDAPTERYPHAVLGDAIEYGAMTVTLSDGTTKTARLDPSLVFEDVAPRLADLDGDGGAEVIVVESAQQHGARLAVWGLRDGRLARLASTPHIGTRFRWLAPLGAADLDGDGRMELPYVDRPHLAKTLRVWRYLPDGPTLEEVAQAGGHTNHRIGERDIAGGIRTCAGRPEMITASADWQRLLATELTGEALLSRDIGAHTGPDSFAAAMECR